MSCYQNLHFTSFVYGNHFRHRHYYKNLGKPHRKCFPLVSCIETSSSNLCDISIWWCFYIIIELYTWKWIALLLRWYFDTLLFSYDNFVQWTLFNCVYFHTLVFSYDNLLQCRLFNCIQQLMVYIVQHE